MEKMKLLEVIPSLEYGGAERLVYDICRLINREKIDLTLLLYYNSDDSRYYQELKDKNINIIVLDKKIGLQPAFFYKVTRVIKSIKPDIIHTHLNVSLYLLPYYFFHKKQKGFHTVHSLAFREQTEPMKKIMGYLFKHRNVKPVAICDTVKNTIYKEYDLDKNSFSIIYNCIDTDKFFLKKSYITGDNVKFIATGRLMEVKNYRLMINAFTNAYEKNNKIRLTILGDGELKTEIQQQINDLDLNNIVKLEGNVSNVQDYLVEADCFLMSSNAEGLPLSVLEAMSCGLPIVSTKAGGVVDIVQNNVNGILVDVGDEHALTNAILKMTDKIKLEQYGKKSYDMSRQYDIKNCVKQYEELFINDKF